MTTRLNQLQIHWIRLSSFMNGVDYIHFASLSTYFYIRIGGLRKLMDHIVKINDEKALRRSTARTMLFEDGMSSFCRQHHISKQSLLDDIELQKGLLHLPEVSYFGAWFLVEAVNSCLQIIRKYVSCNLKSEDRIAIFGDNLYSADCYNRDDFEL